MHGARDVAREAALVVGAQRPVPHDAQPRISVARAPQALERLEHDSEPVPGIEAPDEQHERPAAGRELLDRLGLGAEVVLVDPVGNDPPVEIGEVVVERRDARLRDDHVPLQPSQAGMRGRADEVAHAPRREDGVVGADADGVGRQCERGEHERARVVGGMHVHDVEAASLEEPAERLAGRLE